MEPWALILAALIGAIPTTIAALFGGWYLRRENKELVKAQTKQADGSASESIADAVGVLLTPLNKRIADLESLTKTQETQIRALTLKSTNQQSEITELRAGVMLLTNQIVALGHTPIYKPSLRPPDDPTETHD